MNLHRQVETSSARVLDQRHASPTGFPISQQAIKAALDLKHQGWACIEAVINRQECEEYTDGFWDWMSSLGTGVKRNDPSTWKSPNWPPSYRGIINSLEVAHQAFVWKIRKHPKIVKVFADLWGSDALLSSFDSINALPATKQPPKEAWLHVDQAPFRQGLCCVQGLVNLVDVGPKTTGSLLVKDGSHNAHCTFFDKVSKMSPEEKQSCTDHYKFTNEEAGYWEIFKSVGLEGKAGSLFLWDSRAVHTNVFPSATEAMRHVVYTCYQPVRMASEQDLEQKRQAYEQYRLTTHWPAMNIRLFDDDKAVDYYGADGAARAQRFDIMRTRHLVEDRSILQLAGVTPYTAEEARERKALLNYDVEELRAMLRELQPEG